MKEESSAVSRFFAPGAQLVLFLTWIFPLGSILNWVRFTIYCDLDWLRLFEPEPEKKGGPCWLWVEVRKWLIKESGSMRVPPEVVISGLARRVSVDSLWGKPCQPWIPLLVPLATSPFYHLPFCSWWNNNECSHFHYKNEEQSCILMGINEHSMFIVKVGIKRRI